MLNTQVFGNQLKQLGFSFFSGVPCSFLQDLINYAINDCHYVMASNEGDAVAICCGAYLSGTKSVVLMQNSGLTNATSPLTSLNFCFQIPTLGFVSLRGEPGLNDEPQHELMGVITTQMLDIMQIKWEYLSTEIEEAKLQLIRANDYIEQNQTFFFVVKKDTFEKVKLNQQRISTISNQTLSAKNHQPDYPTRFEALKCIQQTADSNTIQLATTGKTGRELYEIEDLTNNLYMVGSMGCISSLGLGLALNKENKKVIVLDGDGSLMMRMGSIPTNAYYSPKNMIHILLDNHTHDSTGGQATISENIDFCSIAAASGYTNSLFAHSLTELKQIMDNWHRNPCLTFVHLPVAKGSKEPLGRPKTKPFQVKERLMKFIAS